MFVSVKLSYSKLKYETATKSTITSTWGEMTLICGGINHCLDVFLVSFRNRNFDVVI